MSFLDVFVQEQQPTSINLEICVWHLELFVGKQAELILDELHSLLYALEILRKSLSLFTFL